MRQIVIMAWKDLVLVGRDKLGLFFIVAFPVLMGVFFGSMYGGIGDNKGNAKTVLAIVDEDATDQSAKFISALGANDAFKIEPNAREQALDRVRRGEIAAMIVIPKGFGKTAGLPWLKAPAVELGADPSRQAEAAMMQGLVLQAMGKVTIDRFEPAIASVNDWLGLNDKSTPAPSDSPSRDSAKISHEDSPSGLRFELVRIEKLDVTHQPAPGSKEALMSHIRSKWDISFPQAMIWGILGCAAAFAISIVRERKQGTLLRLNAARISKSQIILGKALACFLAVLAVITMMVALGMWLGMHPRSPALLALAAVCVATAFVGISILMSVIGRTEEAVSGAAWGLNSVMAMFGGGMIPLAFMPAFMARLSQFSPVKWAVLAMEGAIWRGFTLREMLPPCGVLLAVGAVCLALGSIRLARMVD